ncbi:hypothetical protein GJ496_008261 [Pomphorhynchus laevis]|nr:hypothetical protein GJ496_008261 [Pomphorhynchus laevis]
MKATSTPKQTISACSQTTSDIIHEVYKTEKCPCRRRTDVESITYEDVIEADELKVSIDKMLALTLRSIVETMNSNNVD